MSYRKYPIATDETYHVYNRSIARQPIFQRLADYKRALELINFYRHKKLPTRYSYYNRLNREMKSAFYDTYLRSNKDLLVEILAFALMPNHVHFLLKQVQPGGIARFMSNFENSYAKYYNKRNHRTGSAFREMFKDVRIETDEQLMHVSRYIHLNPVTAYLINPEELQNHAWSSFKDYVFEDTSESFVNTEVVLALFPSRQAYRTFVLDQVGYQRQLAEIKHLLLE